MKRVEKLVLVFAVTQVAAWTGCNAILGNGYGVDDGTDGGGASPDGNPTGDALVEGGGGPGDDAMTMTDGKTPDAKFDAAGCPNGVCPTTLAMVTGPQRITLTSTNVWWASATTLGRVDHMGGNAKMLVPALATIGPPLRRGIAVDSSGIPYVTVPTRGASKCDANLTACGTGFLGGAAGDSSSISINSSIYVGIFDDGTASGTGGIYRADIGGTGPASGSLNDQILDLQMVGATAYFRTSLAIKAGTTASAYQAVELLGDAPLAFVVQGVRLIVATTNNHLRACTLIANNPCTGSIVQTTTGVPSAVAADSTHIVWVEGGPTGSVHRCDSPGCTNHVLLAEGQASPSDVAIDATAIYWANHGDATTGAGGAIMKLPR